MRPPFLFAFRCEIQKVLNTMLKWLHIILLVHPVFILGASAQEPRPMTPVDFVETPRLGGLSLSPDGAQLLYLRSSVNWKENKVVDRYRLRDMESGETISIVEANEAKESFNRGVWKPDGSGFVTILKRKNDKHDQIYFYDMINGALTRLTEHEADVERIRWALDGERIYFLAADGLDEETRKLRKNRFHIREYEERQPKSVWTFDLATKTNRKIIGGEYFVRSYALSRDGSKIIHMRAPGGLIDDGQRGDLWLHDVESGEQQRLTENGYSESNAQISPDNTAFAYIATVNEKGEPYYEDNLFLHRIGDPRPELLMPDLAMEIMDFAWTKDGAGLFVLGNTGLRNELYEYNIEERVLTQLTQGDHTISSWSYLPDIDTHSAKIIDAESPGEIYIMREKEAGFAKATSEYDDWRSKYKLAEQTSFTWKGRGGRKLEGLLVYPVDYVEGEPFPLVTITHGGPRSSSQFGAWNMSRFVPVLTGRGYGVFLPNHRGGTGYGDDFMRDMVGAYFRNAHHDVMDGVDTLIERGLADPDQLIKMGWSAGGHMTNKLITFTDRFKAASSGAGASDWISMYGESDVRFNRTPWFGGAPWERRAPLSSYKRQSMLQDAWRVTTPTLFYVGGNDVRVPPTQSIMMYRGLKANGVETELYIAPGEPHNFRKPSHRLFKINTDLGWFAAHVSEQVYEPDLPEEAFIEKEKEEDENEKSDEVVAAE